MIDPNQAPLPRQLNLGGSFRPQGYYTTFKEWPIYPNSSNQYWSSNDVVRFYNTIDSGVMDPYRSTIDFTVEVDTTLQPVGGIQIDKLATTMFSSLVISSRNIEIQRIQQYDTLSAMLSDLGTAQVFAQNRDSQGMGYTNIPTMNQYQTPQSSSGQITYSWGNGSFNSQLLCQNGISPTRVGSWTGVGTNAPLSGNTTGGTLSPYFVSGLSSSNSSVTNYLWQGLGNTHQPVPPDPNQQYGVQTGSIAQQIVQYQGRWLNVRAQYTKNLLEPNIPDSTTSLLQCNPLILNQKWTPQTMTGVSTTSGFNPANPYAIKIPSTQQTLVYTQAGQWITQKAPLTGPIQGFTKAICPDTCKSANSALISATIPQAQMNQGVISSNKFAVPSQRFSVPVISAIIGALIPADQFLLIQMKALKDLLLQFTISPYGVFTTGYCDVHQFDKVGMSTMQKRAFRLTNMTWNIHLYTFGDQALNAKLTASLVKGIPITTCFYFLGNTFQLPTGQVVRNTWPISCQSQSLSQIYAIFLSNEYQRYSFCRKQFRLSNNIQTMQIRLKTDFFPSQPLQGNAGNPTMIDNQPDNTIFLKQLYWSNNYMFNMNIPMPRINKTNFAINRRCYDPSNTQTYYDPAMLNNASYTWTPKSVNCDTAMGMPYFHQNRYVGMAIFNWTWDPYGHSSQFMTGINTNGNQNFAIEFTTAPQNFFPGDQTLIIFCRANGIVIYQDGGIRVLGR